MGPDALLLIESYGDPLDRHRIRFGSGAGDGLLDHGFSGGAASALGEGCAVGKDGAHHRFILQDGRASDRDRAGIAGSSSVAHAPGSGERSRRGAIQIR